MQELFLGKDKVSSLERCPQLRGLSLERVPPPNAGTGLPQVDMMYYNLPVEQMDPLPRDKQVQSRANLPNERRLQLVKAITISLGVQGHQQHLVRLLLLLFLLLRVTLSITLLHISVNVWANCQYMSLFVKGSIIRLKTETQLHSCTCLVLAPVVTFLSLALM